MRQALAKENFASLPWLAQEGNAAGDGAPDLGPQDCCHRLEGLEEGESFDAELLVTSDA